ARSLAGRKVERGVGRQVHKGASLLDKAQRWSALFASAPGNLTKTSGVS
ncbi:MAG: hypothetical protein ACI8QF_002721, partial [Limisphaerales bacterium]